MADRTAAYLFGSIFDLIDVHVPKDEQKKIALEYWKQSRAYDFSPYQMGVDETLIRLGLACKGVDPRYPDDGETVLYGPNGDE